MTSTPDNPTPDEPPVQTDDVSHAGRSKKPRRSSRFIIRGMATLLPAVMTLWLLVVAYGFIRDKIAEPINWGIQSALIAYTDWPVPTDEDYADVWQDRQERLTTAQKEDWQVESERIRDILVNGHGDPASAAIESSLREQRLAWMKLQPQIVLNARRVQLEKKWDSIAIGNWHVLDLIGLIVAIVLFYFSGVIMSNVLGRQIRDRGEKLIDRVPLIRRVYPAVKQITEFFFGDNEQQLKFNRVVAVEYPRKGLYSVGLVTGDTMRTIEEAMGEPCLTVFVPSSPTPFTGYVITVPAKDTIDLGISIEDALKFAVSGGVLVPPSQLIHRTKAEHDRRGQIGDRRAQPAAEGVQQSPDAGNTD